MVLALGNCLNDSFWQRFEFCRRSSYMILNGIASKHKDMQVYVLSLFKSLQSFYFSFLKPVKTESLYSLVLSTTLYFFFTMLMTAVLGKKEIKRKVYPGPDLNSDFLNLKSNLMTTTPQDLCRKLEKEMNTVRTVYCSKIFQRLKKNWYSVNPLTHLYGPTVECIIC